MFSETLLADARQLLEVCRERKLTLATAESCTGGLIAALFTEIAGSSDVVECGFVTYSNRAKEKMLEVDVALIQKHGAVSVEVATAMANGARKRSKASITVAVTGIAGPGGATKNKPVGLVFIAVAYGEKTIAHEYHFQGNRQQVRLAAVGKAVEMIKRVLAYEQVLTT